MVKRAGAVNVDAAMVDGIEGVQGVPVGAGPAWGWAELDHNVGAANAGSLGSIMEAFCVIAANKAAWIIGDLVSVIALQKGDKRGK